jgi:hypothetical protein
MGLHNSLVYDRFPGCNAPSQVNIVAVEQLHNTACETQIIQLKMFTFAVDIMSSDVPRRSIARIRVPLRFWIYVLMRRAKPELHVIHRRISLSPSGPLFKEVLKGVY